MNLYSLSFGIALVAGLFLAAPTNQSYATTSISCTATLESSQEVPSVDSEGTGSASLEFDESTNEISWTIEFSNLTGSATSAHFHGPAESGANAGVQVNIGEISGLNSPLEGEVELTSDQAEWLLNEELYINVHTVENPDGEIRGQVICDSIPDGEEPDSAAVVIGDQEFTLEYSISGGTVEDLSADPAIQTLFISITTSSNGNLTIWLPTEAIDSEEDFSVFIDGEYGNFVVDELNETDDSRGLRIEFPMGAEEIEIVGTSMAGSEDVEPETISITIDGQSYDIPFKATGGSLQTATANVDSKSIVFGILSNGSGSILLWLPNNVIDADESFTVMVDGEQANFTELQRTGNMRLLEIQFGEGAEEITVAGTSIVPEFGALAVVIASMVIGGAIVAGRRFLKFGGQRL